MSTYIRLTDYKDSDSKEQGFFKNENRYEAKQDDFEKIPGSPIAYWSSERVRNFFTNNKLKNISEIKNGLGTTNNDLFVREWVEVNLKKIGFNYMNRILACESKKRWFPYNKGGETRKWYGNMSLIVDWEGDGKRIRKATEGASGGRIVGSDFYFKSSISWSLLGNKGFASRTFPTGFIFDVNGSSLFPLKSDYYYITSYLSSKIAFKLLSIINPTMAFQIGNIASLPIIFPKQESIKQQIDSLTQECIGISKKEWDSRETSWDFTRNELLKHKSDSKIETAYNNYCSYWNEKFYKLHANEEELSSGSRNCAKRPSA